MINDAFSAFNTKDDPVIKHSKKQKKAKKLSTTYEEVIDGEPVNTKDYEKIISIQERIIKAKEREFEQIEKLFLHYLDKYETYSWWYSKYRLYYDAIVKVIKSTGDARLVYELKKQITQGDMSYWGSDD
mgnify:CR=1 FL=1